MIKKIRIVYYCDFCKKKLMRINAMEQHEKHCTANLDRKCRVCEDDNVLPDYREIIKDLKARYIIVENKNQWDFISHSVKWIGEEITRDTLAKLADNCPACMLTLWRAIDDIVKPGWDYQEEMKAWWNEINIIKYNGGCYG